MPITKSAIKAMRQSSVKRSRNQATRNEMKSMIKLYQTYLNEGKVDQAKKILSKVVSSIDTAAKKNIIHKKNAANKKSNLHHWLVKASSGKTASVATPKKEAKKTAPKKKATKKSA